MYTCMGQTDGQGHTDVLGCIMYGRMYRCIGYTDIWGMFGGIQTYRGCTDK